MRLTAVDIRDYRSIFVDDSGRSLTMQLARGMNTLVGPNNCGKSNVLRAISLALDPNPAIYSSAFDVPGPRPFSHPVITLDLQAEGEPEGERVLVEAARMYEMALGTPRGDTYASGGLVRLRVSFVPTATGVERREILLTPGERSASTTEHERLLAHALQQLRDALRFVMISSGESIESVLEGNLREILHSVVRERLHTEFNEAEASRTSYIHGLQDSLLAPLRDRLREDVGRLFPEIDGIGLTPEVSSIDRTLANVALVLEDIVSTPLDRKGTGVRGGVLVAMLSYLALNATRGMVFAIEEPEAFLHPAAQEELRDRLEDLAAAPGVTLLVTTHSPFVVTRSSLGRAFGLDKDVEGRTRVSESAGGDADHTPLIGNLLREMTMADLLAAATEIPAGAKAVVLVEGDGDRLCFQRAAHAVGRPDLLDGLHLRPTGGTTKLVAEAVLAKAASNRPVLVVVDNDGPGKHARQMLTGDHFRFQGSQVLNYSAVFEGNKWKEFPVEAEDLFEPSLIQGFVDEHGMSIVHGFTTRPDGARHYDLGQSAKGQLDAWLAEHTRAEHVRLWLELIVKLRDQVGLPSLGTVDQLLSAAADAELAAAHGTAGVALIVAGQHDFGRYTLQRALLSDPDQQLPDGITHVGFYTGGAIQPAVPAIEAIHPLLLFSARTASQLRTTGRAQDERAAALIESAVAAEADLADQTFRVILLSDPEDDATIKLPEPIANTKTARNGRPLAWTVGPRTVAVAHLMRSPTTGRLDELERQQEQPA